MKKTQSISLWRAIVLLTAVFLFFACKPGDGPGDPTEPVAPLIAPVVHIGAATKVTATTASIIAWVTPNGINTTISFEYKNSTESSYHVKTLGTDYSGKDSIKVTFDFSDLVANSEYLVKVRASNKAGNVPSDSITFTTYIAKDLDGNSYNVVRIGTQLWLQQNLRTTHYANGDAIETKNFKYWGNYDAGSYYCYYGSNSENDRVYGALYNWGAAIDTRGFIPGYHLPSTAEFTTLQSYLGGRGLAFEKLVEAGHEHWLGDWGTNSSGFTALGAGGVDTSVGTGPVVHGLKQASAFQTSEDGTVATDYHKIFYLSSTPKEFFGCEAPKTDGCSIRLIKN